MVNLALRNRTAAPHLLKCLLWQTGIDGVFHVQELFSSLHCFLYLPLLHRLPYGWQKICPALHRC